MLWWYCVLSARAAFTFCVSKQWSKAKQMWETKLGFVISVDNSVLNNLACTELLDTCAASAKSMAEKRQRR